MVKTTMRCSRTWQPEPRERHPRRPPSETTTVSLNWRGPHLARLDAWFERRERILRRSPNAAEQSETLPQSVPVSLQRWNKSVHNAR